MVVYYVNAYHDPKNFNPFEQSYWTMMEPSRILQEELADYVASTEGMHEAIVAGEDIDQPLMEVRTEYCIGGHAQEADGNPRPQQLWRAEITIDDGISYASVTYSAYDIDQEADRKRMVELMKGWISDASAADVRNMIDFLWKRIG